MLIVVGCMWLVVGGIAIAAHVGLRLVLNQLPDPDNGNPNIAQIVMEPMLDMLLPILFIALVIGAVVQTVKLLFSLVSRGNGSPKPTASRRSTK